jgi:cyclophilin family peptidyl-prolyl cis-trans isomerase
VDALTGAITGIPTGGGVFAAQISADLAGGMTISDSLTLRVIHPPGPPVVTAPIAPIILTPGMPPPTLALGDYFDDPDTEVAVRFVTSLGSFNVALYQEATPLTVANFLKYVDGTTQNGGNLGNSIVHRAAAGFVVQGGGFKPGTPPQLTGIPTDPSPTNEPGISNVAGTVAMAKREGNPNSATSQWFVNLGDNSGGSAALDTQNGGFTAFGRVLANGMTVLQAIDALPKGTYNNLQILYPPPTGLQSANFTNWPVNGPPPAPAALDQTKLVLLQSVTRISPLQFTISPVSGPELALVMLDQGELSFLPLDFVFGDATFLIRATDLDGGTGDQTLHLGTRDTFAAWAQRNNLTAPEDVEPLADPEDDGAANVIEFVLGGAPQLVDASRVLPVIGTIAGESGPVVTIEFAFRKFLSGHRLSVEGSDSLAAGAWATLWSESDGLQSPAVVSSQDLGDRFKVVIRDPQSPSRKFLRMKVELVP